MESLSLFLHPTDVDHHVPPQVLDADQPLVVPRAPRCPFLVCSDRAHVPRLIPHPASPVSPVLDIAVLLRHGRSSSPSCGTSSSSATTTVHRSTASLTGSSLRHRS
jgi:hypothetical protein